MKRKEQELLKKSLFRAILLIVAFFSLAFGILLTAESMTGKEKEPAMSYKSEGKIDYTVNLKENEIYSTENINKESIISKYLDSIEVSFRYEFSSSKAISSNNKYSIKAYLVNNYIDNNEKKELWTKEYNLVPEITNNINDKAIVLLTDSVIINYDEYNEIAKMFRRESGVLTDSYIEIVFSVNNELEESQNQFNFSDNKELLLKVSLIDTITSIEEIGEFTSSDTIYNIKRTNTNYTQLSIGVCLLLVSIFFVLTAVKMFVDVNGESKYSLELNKILKRYGDVIAETSTKPDVEKSNIIEITNFIDLINIEDELRVPILFYEVSKGKESWFIISHNDNSYRYVLERKHAKTKKKEK